MSRRGWESDDDVVEGGALAAVLLAGAGGLLGGRDVGLEVAEGDVHLDAVTVDRLDAVAGDEEAMFTEEALAEDNEAHEDVAGVVVEDLAHLALLALAGRAEDAHAVPD